MDLSKTEKLSGPFLGMTELPIVRQIGLMLGLAASIALGVAIVIWSQKPNFAVLYSGMKHSDISEISQVLNREGIKFKAEMDTGTLLVDSSMLDKAKLELAADGLPKGNSVGYEMLKNEEGFGTSSFLQNARYHRAKEEELARTIATMAAVRNARVHLALPKETAFLRDRKQASASVMLEVASGSTLSKRQVASIVHLVASSIDNLAPENVTVVDADGSLLSKHNSPDGMELSDSQFEYTRKIEHHYSNRIENILIPIVGKNKVRAQVVANIDFTRSEVTRESFIPDPQAVRSKDQFEEQMTGSNVDSGVPGALSNEPPGAGQAPEKIVPGQANTATTQLPGKNQRRSTTNYELDRMITHTKTNPAFVKRLSVAVVVDDKQVKSDAGEITTKPYTPEELTQLTRLVKEAIGFNTLRGDTVNIINSTFIQSEKLDPLPEIPVWQQSWFWEIVKQVAAGLGVLFIVFGVLKPTLRGLSAYSGIKKHDDNLADDQLTLNESGSALPPPHSYEDDLSSAKALASQEPKLVAQVVKNWVAVE